VRVIKVGITSDVANLERKVILIIDNDVMFSLLYVGVVATVGSGEVQNALSKRGILINYLK